MSYALQTFYDSNVHHLYNSTHHHFKNLHKSTVQLISKLSNNTTSLIIHVVDHRPMLKLPDSITTLKIKGNIIHHCEDVKYIGCRYSCPIHKLPSSLQTLIIGKYYIDVLPEFPESLLRLKIASSIYNCQLPVLRASLIYLELGFIYEFPLHLPPHLKHLSVYRNPVNDINNLLDLKYLATNDYDTTIPPNVTHLKLLPTLKTYDNVLTIPISITNVEFGWSYNQLTFFPDGVQHIVFGDHYNQITSLPPSIISVTFGSHYNQPTVLPEGIKRVIFSEKYNQPTIIPHSVQYIVFGCDYNHPTIIPHSVKYIDFGYHYNQETILPEGVEHVVFGHKFNKTILLPHSILHVEFGYRYHQPTVLPSNIKYVSFKSHYQQPIIFPDNINYIDMAYYGVQHQLTLPAHLVEFNVPCDYALPITFPPSIRKIIYSGDYNYPVILPEHVEHVEFGDAFDQMVHLPSSIRHLTIGQHFNKHNILPKSLESIYVFMDPDYVFWEDKSYMLIPFVEQLLENYNLVDINIIYANNLDQRLLSHVLINNHNRYWKYMSIFDLVL